MPDPDAAAQGRAVPAVPIDPAPPQRRGRTAFGVVLTLAMTPFLSIPSVMAVSANASPIVVLILGVAGWIGGLLAVSALLSGRGWLQAPSLARAFTVYVSTQVAATLIGAIAIGVIVALLGMMFKHASCPHVYSHDGASYQLDADPLSGAFMRGAERDDLVRLDHARAVDGRYRLEIRDELPEKDALDRVELVVVDHAAGVDVLPSQDGRIFGLARVTPPITARDGGGVDRRAALLSPDDGAFVAMNDGAAADLDSATLILTFDRSAYTGSFALALRAHGTPFAEDALVRYLAAMGPGLGKLMGAAEKDERYAYEDRIRDEVRKLGLPLYVEVDEGSGFVPAAELSPVGPAIQRTQAVPLPVSSVSAGGSLRVRLRWTPRFWAIDAASLGTATVLAPTTTLKPARADGPVGSTLDPLRAADGERVVLSKGEKIALAFDAPAAPRAGEERAVLLSLRGYYEMDLGDGYWLNPGAIVAHDTGLDSLPRFAKRLARWQPALAREGVR